MFTHTPDIIPFKSPIKAEFLSEVELEIIKGKTLHVINEVGFHFPSIKALCIFESFGALMDFNSQIVRISPGLVEKAISAASPSFLLAGREERLDLKLDGKRSYISTDGTGIHVIELETRQKRPSSKSDIAMVAYKLTHVKLHWKNSRKLKQPIILIPFLILCLKKWIEFSNLQKKTRKRSDDLNINIE